MKKLVFLLMLLPAYGNAVCYEMYFDKNGQSHSQRCGAMPHAQCIEREDDEGGIVNKGMYWAGQSCQKVKIIASCEKQGGKWQRVHLEGKPISPESFANMCVCPGREVWDGKRCRSDIPLSRQCKGSTFDDMGNTYNVRITEGIYGSQKCPRFLK